MSFRCGRLLARGAAHPSSALRWRIWRAAPVPPACGLVLNQHRRLAAGGRFSDQLATGSSSEVQQSPPRPILANDGTDNIANASLLGGSPTQHLLLHDYRDEQTLRQASALGFVVTLFPTGALTYAFLTGMPNVVCSGLTLLAVGALLMVTVHFRTYVAKLVLDPRRGVLKITGCNLLGNPLAEEQIFPLALLNPGVKTDAKYIRFRIRGQFWDPARWMWYRIPRADGVTASSNGEVASLRSTTSPKTLSAFRQSSATVAIPPISTDDQFKQNSANTPNTLGQAKPTRRFLGAGLGAAVSAESPSPIAPMTPVARRKSEVDSSLKHQARPENISVEALSPLAGLRLRAGLPSDAREEQKLVEFFSAPTTYAA